MGSEKDDDACIQPYPKTLQGARVQVYFSLIMACGMRGDLSEAWSFEWSVCPFDDAILKP